MEATLEVKIIKLKRFYCCTKDLCSYRNEWATNNRCFATYAVRSSCPNLMRQDGKSWKQGSKESDEFYKEGEK